MTSDQPDGAARRFCTSCGTPLTPGNAFCTGCGAAAAGPAAGTGEPIAAPDPTQVIPPVTPPSTPAPSTPAPSTQAPSPEPVWSTPAAPVGAPAEPEVLAPAPAGRPGRRRTPLLVGLVLMLVLAGGGGVAAWLLSGGDDEARETVGAGSDVTLSPAEPTESTAPSGSAVTPEPSPSTSASDEASPSASGSATTVTCWDGGSASKPTSCGAPKGIEGIVWLFRSIDADQCVAENFTEDRDTYTCSREPIKINFSDWRRFTTAERYYSKKLGKTPEAVEPEGLVRWVGLAPSGQWNGAMVYRDLKWGVSLYADTQAEVVAALDALGARPASEYFGIVSP